MIIFVFQILSQWACFVYNFETNKMQKFTAEEQLRRHKEIQEQELMKYSYWLRTIIIGKIILLKIFQKYLYICEVYHIIEKLLGLKKNIKISRLLCGRLHHRRNVLHVAQEVLRILKLCFYYRSY